MLAESALAATLSVRTADPQGTGDQQQLRNDLALALHEQRNAHLQEANERLAEALAHARELQSASEQAQRRQTEFLAVLAHELRSPLAPILTAAELLERVGMDPRLPSKARAIIERQVLHISRLVDDLLDLSRASTGKLRLEFAVVDLKDIIEATIDARRPAAERRRQRLVVAVPAPPLQIDGDPVRLAQVLGNLLDNACKYTPDGGTIELMAALAGDSVVLTVSDSGIGIAADALPYVFEPFTQGSHGNGPRGSGLGLGLAVASDLVEAHGGCVVAHSAGAGSGSRFVVTLPLAAAADRPEHAARVGRAGEGVV